MIARADLQRNIKRGFLEEACRGLPGAPDTPIEWVESAHVIGYRQRARLGWHNGTLGYRTHRSRRVTDIDRCIVLRAPLQEAWNEARRILGPHLAGAGEIQLQLTHASGVAIRLDAANDQPAPVFSACETLSSHPSIAGVALRVGRSGRPAVWGDDHVTIGAGKGESLDAPYGAFSQANDDVNEKLVDAVLELAAPEGLRVLELHCGVGNFTVRLAASAKSIVGVERDPEAAAACRDNLARRGLRGHIEVRDADDPPKGRYDVVVLDPPRQGSRAFFERSGVLPGPARLIYVSCDTATLARDLRIAAALGFRLDRAIAFDMFPQTAHLESVVRLVRA
jgi:23S rRNA (uracil1939-C5)-methyltransferase